MFERLNHAARQIIVHTTQGNTFTLMCCQHFIIIWFQLTWV